MTVPRATPDAPGDATHGSTSNDLARFVYRPAVFEEPHRTVHPPSWLEHIPFAFWIIDVVRPETLVELGTQSGNSYAAFAQAISTLKLATRAYAIDTWKGDDHTGYYEEQVFDEWRSYHDTHFSSFSRLVRSTFAEAVEHFADGSVDVLHLDGCHRYEAASADLELWRPKMSPRGVVLLHDTNVREREFGVWRVWDELKGEFPSFEFLHGHGLGVIAVGPEIVEPLRWLLGTTQSSPDAIVAVRRFFAQRGAAISARYALDAVDRAIRSALQPEAVRHQEISIQTVTHELARLREELRQKSQNVMQLNSEAEALRAVVEKVESELRATQRIADETNRRLQDESARRTQAELERDQLATSMYRRVRTRIVRGLKRIEAGSAPKL